MARKLLAFLGTNDYLECNYVLPDGRRVDNVRFVQEAIVRLTCMDWSRDDSLIVFLTPEAERTNWLDGGQPRRVSAGADCTGLGNVLARLATSGLQASIRPVTGVPNGNTTDEIWQIFSTIVEQVQEGDELVFDVTYGFRSLPMLAVVLANYLRAVRNATVTHIFYGAFESLGPILEVKKIPIEKRDAPLLDLIAFVALFDWTAAVRDFLVRGVAGDLKKCAERDVAASLAKAGAAPSLAKSTRCLVTNLECLLSSIATCRCPAFTIQSKRLFRDLKTAIRNCKAETLPALAPLLARIEAKVAPFEDGEMQNGLAAARWCLEHGLIQQGYTILDETYVSVRLEQWFGMERVDLMNYEHRKLVKAVHFVLRYQERHHRLPPDEEIRLDRRSPASAEDIRRVARDVPHEEIEAVKELEQTRNDLNHAGWRRQGRHRTSYEETLARLIGVFESLLANGPDPVTSVQSAASTPQRGANARIEP